MVKITINADSGNKPYLKIFRAKLLPMTWGLIWLYLLYYLTIEIVIEIDLFAAKDRKIDSEKFRSFLPLGRQGAEDHRAVHVWGREEGVDGKGWRLRGRTGTERGDPEVPGQLVPEVRGTAQNSLCCTGRPMSS